MSNPDPITIVVEKTGDHRYSRLAMAKLDGRTFVADGGRGSVVRLLAERLRDAGVPPDTLLNISGVDGEMQCRLDELAPVRGYAEPVEKAPAP